MEEIGSCLINLGVAESERGAIDEAIAYYERAVAEFERIGHGSGRAIGYSNLAWELANRGDFDDAETYCDKAIDLPQDRASPRRSGDDGHDGLHPSPTWVCRGGCAAGGGGGPDVFLELGAQPKSAQSLDLAASAWEEAGDEARADEARSRARALA